MDLRETLGRIDKSWWQITCKRREKNQRWLAKVSKVINECLEAEDWLYNVFASLGKSEKFWLGEGILVCSEKGRNLQGLHNECVRFVRWVRFKVGWARLLAKREKKINFWTHLSHRKGFRDVALILRRLYESKGGRKPILGKIFDSKQNVRSYTPGLARSWGERALEMRVWVPRTSCNFIWILSFWASVFLF